MLRGELKHCFSRRFYPSSFRIDESFSNRGQRFFTPGAGSEFDKPTISSGILHNDFFSTFHGQKERSPGLIESAKERSRLLFEVCKRFNTFAWLSHAWLQSRYLLMERLTFPQSLFYANLPTNSKPDCSNPGLS